MTNFVLNRQVGIELEGYTNENPNDISLPYSAVVKIDGSLRNTSWIDGGDDSDEWSESYQNDYGLEVNTQPMTDLRELESIFAGLHDNGWHVDESASTHIHVDISDFTEFDKAKLLRFCIGIERIMFTFATRDRYQNSYCAKLHKHWRMLFRRKTKFSAINWEEAENLGLMRYFTGNDFPRIGNGKYTWINAFGTRYPTAEFRIFNASTDWNEVARFARLAVAIIDIVKNSTPEQLVFLIQELYKSTSVAELMGKFHQMLNLEFELPLQCSEAVQYLEQKLAQPEEVAI